MMDKNKRHQREIEKEMKKVANAFVLEHPTTTVEGMREYKRLERQIHKTVKSNRKLSRWEYLRQVFIDFWNEEL